ncbi:hypothetical protein PHAVU_001G114600 [Phaseolus vulgaris]|uniref:Uncharacterized protein n=1 Tax=Phaseolus vulgaris TaxID=3885 RepID=V7CYJ1_PHAVU|nr:hypothetical protein PHAVU_001G114600g [Phaseolus vulgaris]ESW33981.1 hypothetical protein PHAVU_001G114600g [Phaseolus vulgaris]
MDAPPISSHEVDVQGEKWKKLTRRFLRHSERSRFLHFGHGWRRFTFWCNNHHLRRTKIEVHAGTLTMEFGDILV